MSLIQLIKINESLPIESAFDAKYDFYIMDTAAVYNQKYNKQNKT